MHSSLVSLAPAGVARTYILPATHSSFVILLAHREKLYVRQIPTTQLLVTTEANTHKAADCLDPETIAACCFAVRAVLRSHDEKGTTK